MPTPKIDDQFWFDMSFDMVKDGVAKLKKAGEKVETVVFWALGIYTAGSVLTLESAETHDALLLFALALPFVFLTLAYWWAHMTQLPSTTLFDPRSPTQIERAYKIAFEKSKRNLNVAKALSLLSLLFFALAVVLTFYLKNVNEDIYLLTELSRVGGQKSVSVTGAVPKETKFTLVISGLADSTNKMKLDSINLISSKSGLFFYCRDVDTALESPMVTVRWRDENYIHQLSKTVDDSEKRNDDDNVLKLYQTIFSKAFVTDEAQETR